MKYISPYKLGSESARAIAQALNIKRITGEKKIKSGSTIINWGNKHLRSFGSSVRVLNMPSAVARCSDKVTAFEVLKSAGVCCVESTTSKSKAESWWLDGSVVYCRKLTSSSEGRGIVIATENDSLVAAPLYTKGMHKMHEYRVHVFSGEVIDYTKKKKRLDADVNPYIKNFSNGWVFCREGVMLPDKVRELAIKSVDALGLDFGAVDVLYKQRDDEAFILEVNSAPGVEGTTLTKYVEAIRRNT